MIETTIRIAANPPPPLPTVQLDWRAYFLEFVSRHGGNYVDSGDGFLLFEDGWRYSNKNYEGPELPPPTDDKALCLLLIGYFRRRWKIVSEELLEVRSRIAQLSAMSEGRSQPLQQKTQSWDTEGGREGIGGWNVSTEAVSLDALEARKSWLQEDVAECLVKLKGLEE